MLSWAGQVMMDSSSHSRWCLRVPYGLAVVFFAFARVALQTRSIISQQCILCIAIARVQLRWRRVPLGRAYEYSISDLELILSHFELWSLNLGNFGEDFNLMDSGRRAVL